MDNRKAIEEPEVSATLIAYAKLYPTILERMRQISHSSDPALAEKMRVILRAYAVKQQGALKALNDRFQLTQAEARIALFLASGGSVKEYAAVSDVSEGTVRVHLKAIFAKTGVHRQMDLVRLLK